MRGAKGKGSGKDERGGSKRHEKKKDKKEKKDKKKKKDRDAPEAGEFDLYAEEGGNPLEAVADGETGWETDHQGGTEEEKTSEDEKKEKKDKII